MITEDQLRQALKRTNGNISAAARELSVSRQTAHSLIKRYQIRMEREVVILTGAEAVARREHMEAGLKAIRAVSAAVKRGDLVPQPCERCGAAKAVAHHYLGYAPEHRLDVRWLCSSHHRRAHLQERGASVA